MEGEKLLLIAESQHINEERLMELKKSPFGD